MSDDTPPAQPACRHGNRLACPAENWTMELDGAEWDRATGWRDVVVYRCRQCGAIDADQPG